MTPISEQPMQVSIEESSVLVIPQDDTGPHSLFPRTHWTVVIEASSHDPAKAREALDKLCTVYRQPIVNWLRRHDYGQDAEDLAHEFVAFLLQKNRLKNFVRREEQFRKFLCTCLIRFLGDLRDKANAQKRGEGVEPEPLDGHDVAGLTDVGKQLDREIAIEVHRRVMARLAQDYAARGEALRFQELRRFVFGKESNTSYADVASRLSIAANSVKKAVFDLRERYFDYFRTEVAQTVSLDELNEETRYIFTLLAETDVVENP
jgi:DNA-directed RNA polymerase specialized sigma24 family protein